MEITINETNKTIKVQGTVKISDLMAFCNAHMINLDEYSIIGTETVSIYPYTIPYTPSPTIPYYPPYYPITICSTDKTGGPISIL